MYEVGKRIKFFREKRGLTQKAFAEEINARNTTVSNWEKGLTRPDADMLAMICNVLKVSADELLNVNITKMELSLEERNLIAGYRNAPEMQEAVKKLLSL